MLHRLGYTLSHDELIRYKQPIVQCDSVDNLPPYPICYTQFVADNVDHNICTTDGQNTFHGVGIIAVSTPCLMDRDTERPVCRSSCSSLSMQESC